MADWFWSVAQATETFKHAMLGVHPAYFSVTSPLGEEQFMERVFAYELYHQMRIRFPVENGEVNNLVVHGEYRKALSFVPELKKTNTYIPDLVVHQSMTVQSNLLAVEIKSSKRPSPEKDLLPDLEKLKFYALSLQFKITAMVLINSRFEDLYFAKEDTRAKIEKIMKDCGRVRVWNIDKPVPKSYSADEEANNHELNPACLRIIGVDDLKGLRPPQSQPDCDG